MPEQDRPGRLSRRAFIQAGLLGAGAAALLPGAVPMAKPRDVPRNRTLTLVWTGREGRWVDHELWNPYAIGSNHQSGPGIFYEPLAYYSAFADKEYLWLAESPMEEGFGIPAIGMVVSGASSFEAPSGSFATMSMRSVAIQSGPVTS